MSTTFSQPATGTGLDDAPESDDLTISPGKIALPVVFGRTSEFFDFFVYGLASVLVFPYVFFSHLEPVEATLAAFAVFALAFIARPIGSVVFMAVDRNVGRAAKLTIALFLLCGSTMAIAFLPSGGLLAPVLLAVFRFGQGLGWGGAWDGLPSLLSLSAPQNKRGWYAMVPQLGAALGFMLASGMFLIMAHWLSAADFLAWGWRFPFFVALALNVVALFARLRLVVTPEFVRLFRERELQPTPVFSTLKSHPREVILGALIPLASYAMFHLVTIFPLSWITLFARPGSGDAVSLLGSLFMGAMVGGAAMMLSGLVANRIGRRRQLGIAAALIAAFSFFAATLLGSDGDGGRSAYVIVGFALLGLSLGQASNAVASYFDSAHRYTGAAITSDIAWLLGAGFAPLVALGVCSRFGLDYVGYYLLSGAVVTLIALALSKTLETR